MYQSVIDLPGMTALLIESW